MNDHDPGEQPTLTSREVPAAITDPDAVSRALGVQVHLIRTQFVRERLASGQCTAEHIAAMLEWEQHAHQNIRMNYASAMYSHGRLSPFDRHCISLEMQDGFHLSPEHYDAAKHLHDECHELWRLQRDEDRDAAHAAIETLKRLGERLRAEIQARAHGAGPQRRGPDRGSPAHSEGARAGSDVSPDGARSPRGYGGGDPFGMGSRSGGARRSPADLQRFAVPPTVVGGPPSHG